MTRKIPLRPNAYAARKYNATEPVDFDVAVSYAIALLAIAGGDGQLADAEMQWYLDEQELLFDDATAYNEAVRKADWKNANLDQLLGAIKYDFSINARHVLLYQAIKMCQADSGYHAAEQKKVAAAAQILGIGANVVTSIESLAALEGAAEQLRLSLFLLGTE